MTGELPSGFSWLRAIGIGVSVVVGALVVLLGVGIYRIALEPVLQFPARITEVSTSEVCAVLDARVLEGTDYPIPDESLCAPPNEFFYGSTPHDLTVGDCVLMSLHHPVYRADEKASRSSCANLGT